MAIKYYYELKQGTDEWKQLRCGVVTASNMDKICSLKTVKDEDGNSVHTFDSTKVLESDKKKIRAFVYEIAAQRLSQYIEPSYINDDMLRGMNDEIKAVSLYSEKYETVTPCGFVTNTFDAELISVLIGYSPDGLVGDDGLIEIKSRKQSHHVATVCSGVVPVEFMLQIQTGLLVTGRKWLDFISYSGGHPMFVKRIYPSQDYFNAIRNSVADFEESVLKKIQKFESEAGFFYPTDRDESFSMI